MNPPMTFAQALVQLKLLTSQTANFTFTDDEMNQVLQAAWNDTYVCNSVWNGSINFTPGTWQYPLPATVDVVQDLYYKRTTTDNPERLSPDLYEIVNGNIQLDVNAPRWLTEVQTIYIKGRYKLTTSDSLLTTNLINYVINLAAEILITNLIMKRAFVFLRNDTTMSDISRALQIIQGNVLRYKQALLREFESA